MLIYRYYSPVWNRNGEGKLQALEKEKEEDDDDKKEKKQLHTGGLEKGEGVEIIVLKAVTKKKNKNKKEKEEKNDWFEDGEKKKAEEK